MQTQDDHQHPCGKCVFYHDSVWQPVANGSVSTLVRGFKRVELEEGQTVFEQNSPSRGVFCVSRGLIAVRSHHPDGTSTVLRLAYPGEIIGFRSFLRNGLHQTEAQALLPSRVCTVARRSADDVIRGTPQVMARLATRCLEEIDENHRRIIAAAKIPNKQRLSELLLRLMKHHGEDCDDHIKMRLPLSRSDLADLLGVQSETLSRLVGRLEKEGRFSFAGREVRIITPHAARHNRARRV